MEIVGELCPETGTKVLVAQFHASLVKVSYKRIADELIKRVMIAALGHVVAKLAVPSHDEVEDLAELEMWVGGVY